MASNLSGKKIAILATDGFEQAELKDPRKALDEAGATTIVLSPKSGEIKGWKLKDWGDTVKVDKTLDDANPNEYDALVLPGGVINPDHLRMDPKAVNAGGGGCGAGQESDVVAIGEDGPEECGRHLGGPGGCDGRPVHLQPQA
jgi:protease I